MDEAFSPSSACPKCGTHIAPSLLVCPVCRQLVHSGRLKQLADKASRAESKKEYVAALSFWREALSLLPPTSKQYGQVMAAVQSLSRHVDTSTAGSEVSIDEKDSADQPAPRSWLKGATGIGSIGLVLWKFKFIIGFVLTKGKLLLMGLTKAGTFWSMLASFGLYWGIWGWKFGLGLVASIYVHEMGHVSALRKFGIKATAPTFIPGLGAVVRMKQHPATPIENARVGLAGPIWGLGAALAAYAVFLITNIVGFAAIAEVGAWINLFNLLPVLPLDGGRGFQALTNKQRWMAAIAIGAAWFLTSEGLLLLLLIGAVVYALKKETDVQPDPVSLWQYIGLVAVLSWMCMIGVPVE